MVYAHRVVRPKADKIPDIGFKGNAAIVRLEIHRDKRHIIDFDPDLLNRGYQKIVLALALEDVGKQPHQRLAVDTDRAGLFDVQDATKVRLSESLGELFIRAIGKEIAPWDAADTGLFLCTPAMAEALRTAGENGAWSLSAAMQRLAREGRALAADVRGAQWLDVDTPEALAEAERRLLEAERGKAHDGPVARYVNRPISRLITRHVANLSITPNQITLFSFALAALAAIVMALPGWPALALGGALAQLSSIIDGVDGEIARLKRQQSAFGAWLDAVLDRYADAFLLFGLTWHARAAALAAGASDAAALLWGFAAIIGSFVNSYTADKYDGFMRRKLGAREAQRFRMGRDVRVFLVFLGALFNLPVLTLAVIALVMNAEVIRRIWVLYRGGA
jgi:CDP-L-myo-inositol myo-inositolphosphotransferase